MTHTVFGQGERIGRYELVRRLGRGSFAQAWLARDADEGRDVAAKILDAGGAGDLKVLELFERESLVLRGLRHHGIPALYEVLRTSRHGATLTVIVMEFIAGDSLADIIESGRSLDSSDVLHLFLELLGILEYLHGRVPPILHRDIKPANIIVRADGSPGLVDFGSVRHVYRAADDDGSTVSGTFGYMPYEQYMGQATPASDLFALAATFLHLLTGRPPRDFMNSGGAIEVPPLLPGPGQLAPILARMLRHAPGERFQSARAVRQAVIPAALVPASGLGGPTSMPITAPPSRTDALRRPVPRRLDDQTRDVVQRLSPGALELMSAGEDVDFGGISDWVSLIFFSVVTAGTLPLVFTAMARTRRRRATHFVTHGSMATGCIDRIAIEKGPFDVPMAKISFSFEADGQRRRGADQVLPAVADRWRVGDEVELLYDPLKAYSAIIVTP